MNMGKTPAQIDVFFFKADSAKYKLEAGKRNKRKQVADVKGIKFIKTTCC